MTMFKYMHQDMVNKRSDINNREGTKRVVQDLQNKNKIL